MWGVCVCGGGGRGYARRPGHLAVMPPPARHPPCLQEEVWRAKEAGVVAFKLYPAGATTNSASGVTDLLKCLPTLRAMAQVCACGGLGFRVGGGGGGGAWQVGRVGGEEGEPSTTCTPG